MWMSHGNEHSAGVCILKNNFSGNILFTDCDVNGHYILLALQFASYMLLPIFMGIIHQKISFIFYFLWGGG